MFWNTRRETPDVFLSTLAMISAWVRKLDLSSQRRAELCHHPYLTQFLPQPSITVVIPILQTRNQGSGELYNLGANANKWWSWCWAPGVSGSKDGALSPMLRGFQHPLPPRGEGSSFPKRGQIDASRAVGDSVDLLLGPHPVSQLLSGCAGELWLSCSQRICSRPILCTRLSFPPHLPFSEVCFFIY